MTQKSENAYFNFPQIKRWNAFITLQQKNIMIF